MLTLTGELYGGFSCTSSFYSGSFPSKVIFFSFTSLRIFVCVCSRSIFDKGQNLPRPEVVPFRLTSNMLDAFGPTGSDGMYSGCLTAAMGTLRSNRDTLLSVLEPFLKDPVIDWKRHRAQQKHGKSGSSHNETVAAKRSIQVINGRLQGIYNLGNPNMKKIKRTDGYSVNQEDETSNILPLSVEGQVRKMISEATSSENLVQLYVGWMPWL